MFLLLLLCLSASAIVAGLCSRCFQLVSSLRQLLVFLPLLVPLLLHLLLPLLLLQLLLLVPPLLKLLLLSMLLALLEQWP
jgi:hypothetical protein